ncbi:MAG: GIY-YIG nuclease family protein [Nitrospirota bacterium]
MKEKATSRTQASERWTVYILHCADRTYYTGIARDPARRLLEHNGQDGRGARYTRARQPVQMVYTETARGRSQAQCREAAIKKLSRAQKIRLVSHGGTTPAN